MYRGDSAMDSEVKPVNIESEICGTFMIIQWS